MAFWEIDVRKTHRQGRKCSKCGTELGQNSNICPKCSHDVTKRVDIKIDKNETQVECPGCKALNKPGSVTCTSCGSNITELKMSKSIDLDILHITDKRKKKK
ncbi:MAG: zinc ribbon domain-containing protein [Candidatus Heimdallarchaeota archaeon]